MDEEDMEEEEDFDAIEMALETAFKEAGRLGRGQGQGQEVDEKITALLVRLRRGEVDIDTLEKMFVKKYTVSLKKHLKKAQSKK